VELAKLRIQQIDNRKDKLSSTLSWLATAELPRRPAPTGPGTPGQRPAFSAGDLDMPAASTAKEPSFDDLLKNLDKAMQPSDDDDDRYDAGGEAPTEGAATEESDAGEKAPSAP